MASQFDFYVNIFQFTPRKVYLISFTFSGLPILYQSYHLGEFTHKYNMFCKFNRYGLGRYLWVDL